MGPFQEYEEKKSPEKGSPRSRIPRLVLHPFRPKDKGSPSASESPTSEEEGKDCDLSSDSKRTISTNSFCSGSEQSPGGSPLLGAQRRQPAVKRVRLMGEWSGERGGERGGEQGGERGPARHKRQQRSAIKSTKGSEADFSSSSSTRSLKTKDSRIPGSAGKQTPRSRTTRTRPLPAFKPAGSPIANRDSELFAPYQTPPRACASSSITTTSSSSSNSSPTARRLKLGRYHSCGDNHGVMAPHPEQYLTPLQQKEVNIRHLKTKLMESENVIHDREADIEELKSQLGRMREDWIEEECHRVEAQLSLKEARKEIRQLRQVVETMKSSLMEKDKGIQKYFVDINIQNRKLESLLQSMELAQSGSNLQDEPSLDFLLGDIPDGGGGGGKAKLEEEGGEALGDQAAEEMADSGLLLNDEMANRVDILERVLMSTAVDFSQDICCKLRPGEGPAVSTLLEEDKGADKSIAVPKNLFSAPDPSASGSSEPPKAENKEMQTEMQMQTETPAPPDLRALLLQLLKLHGQTVGDASVGQLGDPDLLTPFPLPTHAAAAAAATTTDSTPSPAPTESPEGSSDSGMCSAAEPGDGGGGGGGCRFMEELDFSVCEGGAGPGAAPQPGTAAEGKRYWSDSFLVDLVAVAAPVLPTVAWLYSRHGVDGSAPVYNIAALIRGCCIMGLHSLRRVA
ncbi:Syntabulin [Merluccius polli]|uniref:Syntabulin n=1 Tax=Merluccius polli TaxID=89951 RepID=A0AA47LZ41_MERPO|nr:Syntabulin [Merluccius polli]